MESHKNTYPLLCSYKNLEKAFNKARKGKSFMPYVVDFEKNKELNLLKLKNELETFSYKPSPLKKFIIQDPKTRVIRKSHFRDRIVHHAIVNILEPIYEKIFIFDSYANRISKGTIAALKRFDNFKRKASGGGALLKNAKNNNLVKGYILKADIKHFFDSVNHEVLLDILKRKIKDKRVIWLVSIVLKNFPNKEKGMPLGNMTSQFFANVYLNELDYFIKHKLRMKAYLRYVDDFVILYESKEVLNVCKDKISKYLKYLKLELHKDKTKIFSLSKGTNLLGFRIFYYYRLLRKRNINQFNKRLEKLKEEYKDGLIDYEQIIASLQGWFAYAIWANTYKLRKSMLREVNEFTSSSS
ncbi:MAG: reverse transcriptase/maturase family protein [Candidatus Woesearchaeota archaeon]